MVHNSCLHQLLKDEKESLIILAQVSGKYDNFWLMSFLTGLSVKNWKKIIAYNVSYVRCYSQSDAFIIGSKVPLLQSLWPARKGFSDKTPLNPNQFGQNSEY